MEKLEHIKILCDKIIKLFDLNRNKLFDLALTRNELVYKIINEYSSTDYMYNTDLVSLFKEYYPEYNLQKYTLKEIIDKSFLDNGFGIELIELFTSDYNLDWVGDDYLDINYLVNSDKSENSELLIEKYQTEDSFNLYLEYNYGIILQELSSIERKFKNLVIDERDNFLIEMESKLDDILYQLKLDKEFISNEMGSFRK